MKFHRIMAGEYCSDKQSNGVVYEVNATVHSCDGCTHSHEAWEAVAVLGYQNRQFLGEASTLVSAKELCNGHLAGSESCR